jgi:hypothetical protein
MLRSIVAALLLSAAAVAAAETPAPTPTPEPVPTPAAPTGDHALGDDPNYSRLLFAPTGRPLKKGDGYFSDYEVLVPGLAVGITDHISIAGGISMIPGLGLDEQVLYVSPRVGWELGDKAAVSAGFLYAAVPADDDIGDLGIGFVVGTFGSRQRSLSVGLGVGGNTDDDFDAQPILMIGGQATVSRHVAVISENWLALDRDFDIADQPLGIGLRFFGDRLSADVGLVFTPSTVGDGGFLPWASFSYHFGPSAAGREKR